MDLNDIKEMGRWQVAIVAAGVAFLVAAVAARDKQLVVTAIGAVVFGIGQMRSHPRQTRVVFDNLGRITGQITGHPRTFSSLGVAMEIIGGAMFFGGLVWFVLT